MPVIPGFAWTGEYNSVPWIVPTLAGVFLATSILLIFVAYLNYITDSYLMFAASALAANTVCRSACGAASPLFTQYMFNALGVGGGGSLIGGVAVLLAPIPFVFYKYGEPIRKRSKFAPTDDKPAEEKESKEQNERNNSSSSVVSDSGETTVEDGPQFAPIVGPKDVPEVDAEQSGKPRGDMERDLEKGE